MFTIYKKFPQFGESYTGFPFVCPSSGSLKSQSRSPSLIAIAGTKFFPRLRAHSNGRSTDNVRPGWPFVRTNFRQTCPLKVTVKPKDSHFERTRKQATRNKTKRTNRTLFFLLVRLVRWSYYPVILNILTDQNREETEAIFNGVHTRSSS